MRNPSRRLAGLCATCTISAVAFAAGSGDDKQLSLTSYDGDLALLTRRTYLPARLRVNSGKSTATPGSVTGWTGG
jgi:hypothetical protein